MLLTWLWHYWDGLESFFFSNCFNATDRICKKFCGFDSNMTWIYSKINKQFLYGFYFQFFRLYFVFKNESCFTLQSEYIFWKFFFFSKNLWIMNDGQCYAKQNVLSNDWEWNSVTVKVKRPNNFFTIFTILQPHLFVSFQSFSSCFLYMCWIDIELGRIITLFFTLVIITYLRSMVTRH